MGAGSKKIITIKRHPWSPAHTHSHARSLANKKKKKYGKLGKHGTTHSASPGTDSDFASAWLHAMADWESPTNQDEAGNNTQHCLPPGVCAPLIKKAEQKMLFTSGHFVTVCIALNHKCNDWEWGSHCTQEKTTKRGAGACQNSAKRAEPQINVFLHIWEVQKPWVTNCGDRFHYRACKSNPGGASPPAVLQRCPQIRQSLPRGPPWASLLHYICKPPWYYLHCCTNTPLEGEEGALLWQVQLDRQKHCPQPRGTGTSFQQPCRQFSCSYPRCPEQSARGAQRTKSSGFRSSPGPPGKSSRLVWAGTALQCLECHFFKESTSQKCRSIASCVLSWAGQFSLISDKQQHVNPYRVSLPLLSCDETSQIPLPNWPSFQKDDDNEQYINVNNNFCNTVFLWKKKNNKKTLSIYKETFCSDQSVKMHRKFKVAKSPRWEHTVLQQSDVCILYILV